MENSCQGEGCRIEELQRRIRTTALRYGSFAPHQGVLRVFESKGGTGLDETAGRSAARTVGIRRHTRRPEREATLSRTALPPAHNPTLQRYL